MISAKLYPEDLDVDGLSLITGFHGIGSTGFLALNHLINTLKPDRIGVFETDYLSPISSINSGKIITPFEIYKKDNIAFLRVAVPPLQGNEILLTNSPNICLMPPLSRTNGLSSVLLLKCLISWRFVIFLLLDCCLLLLLFV